MNIWLPILSNVLAALIVVFGILEGRKNGFGLQLLKTLLLSGALIGLYFLSPIVTNLLFKIPMIAQFSTLASSFPLALNSVVYLILFLIIYLIVTRLIISIRNAIVNKKVKASVGDKKLIKRQRKAILKSKSKLNKVFGSIFGIITSLALVFIIMMPVKYIPETMVEINEQINELPEDARNQVNIPNFTDAQLAFDYTLFGQLDKVTHVYDIINNIGD